MARTNPAQDSVAVSLVVIPGACWRCHHDVWPVAGVFVADGSHRRWLEFRSVAARLATAVTPEQLAALGIGPIKVRASRARPQGYLANGCLHCDAILGNHPLREDLVTFLAEDGGLNELIVVTLILPRRNRPPHEFVSGV